MDADGDAGRYRQHVDQELPLLPLPLSQRLSVRQWVIVDIVLAALLAGGAIGGSVAGLDGPGRDSTAWLVFRCAVIVTMCLALPYRRLHPMAALVVIGAGMIVMVAAGSRGPLILSVILAVYSVASVSPPQASLWAAAAVAGGMLAASVAVTGHPSLAGPPLILVGWLAGENTRTRRAYIAGVTQWAAERDRQREERSRRAVADERLRIARELHDVVAHTMSVVAVRSSVARVVLESEPDEVRHALEIIEVASRRALQEMRLLVGVLRDGDAGNDLSPAPGLADLPALITEIGAAGVPVTMRIEGTARPLPAGVDVSAYRIVQEALTNVVRHARPTDASLQLRYRPDEIEIEVSDRGRGRPRSGTYPPYPTPSTTASLARAAASASSRPHAGATTTATTTAARTATAVAGPATATIPTAPPAPYAPPTPPIPSAPSAPNGAVFSNADAIPTGGSSTSNGIGHGLVGMRERVALFGGTFSSGPVGPGYRVVAVLPTDERGSGQP